ncbi:rhodanese-like domain-containing protein [Halalkalibacter krulwichiae]|uniref:Putative adenylyltransferase/sulfurtransferase MoeZ n=1 Tax=Halalkalibacter krulwichiae TaxID=199441 RepID=A0A1X9MDK5_9BACI|nr:rhodanese-like domain-containing protein [Halalkalibacter krulwichiae]ARK31525.1 putative adenylyltransferase/sulfurtransferase MoeZ [Halalkalibacter krulwichiae]
MGFEQDGIIQVEKEELKELIKGDRKDPIIIDVRELEEYEEAHIPGVPLIPMGNIPNVVKQLDKEQSYLFVCRSGGRSQNVAMYLQSQGFKHVQNYFGGMLAWDGEVQSGLEWVVKDVSELKK